MKGILVVGVSVIIAMLTITTLIVAAAPYLAGGVVFAGLVLVARLTSKPSRGEIVKGD